MLTIAIGNWLAADDLAKRSPPELNPAAWGSDHVGRPLPEYVTGEECLFCHRKDVGATLLKKQSADGSWKDGHVGYVFTTAVNATILQLDKGYIPIYQR